MGKMGAILYYSVTQQALVYQISSNNAKIPQQMEYKFYSTEEKHRSNGF